MKKGKIFKLVAFTFFVFSMLSITTSCKEELTDNFGTISGIVTDDFENPIKDVTISVKGLEGTSTTNEKGEFSIKNVEIKSQSVTFEKDGYQTVTVTVSANQFKSDKVATLEVIMINASAKIIGVVTDAKNDNAPLEGVLVQVSENQTATTGADGSYSINNLTIEDYTVTFSKENYTTITRNITVADFIDGEATVNVEMGNVELLRGLTIDDLVNADKWYYNEFRGGRNADDYPHWDWACNYMSTLTFWGAWQEQNEGTTLQIRNNEEFRNNPADLEVFDSYVYGSKKITNDNKIMSVRLRTHNADANNPAYFGVQVIDLSTAEKTAEKIGENKTYGSGDYTDFEFDLSSYVGKEVIIAIGIYRKETGDYWKQLVLRAIRFADRKVEGWGWLPGTEVINGWKLTQETVRSTMVNTKKVFTGISPISGNRDNYIDAYRSWIGQNHIAAEWSFVPVRKDPEVFPSEGYLIKTRNTADVDTEVPESFFYAKFAIAAGNNELVLKTRNFGSNYTYFKLTAIENNGTVTHIAPSSNTAEEASAAENGTWKFKHGAGGAGDPDAYASFVYDLSGFNGKDVTLALGVFNGAASTGENKLVLYNIELK
ncbi:MAG: hypothetical protein BGO29_07950 [Bacteroidales bacterium 36-12]|nr:MAG: hypothetical protein BGO29_07950 [Bacteroidales bacterium 36-12]